MSIYEYLWVKVTQNGSKWKIDSENATKLYLYMDIYLQKHDANPISIVNAEIALRSARIPWPFLACYCSMQCMHLQMIYIIYCTGMLPIIQLFANRCRQSDHFAKNHIYNFISYISEASWYGQNSHKRDESKQSPKTKNEAYSLVTVLHNCKTGPTCLEETKHFTSSKANSGSSRATCERNADPRAGFPPWIPSKVN